MAIVNDRSPIFETVLGRLIGCIYFFIKCGIKTKTHFEWLLRRWFSFGQLNLEPTRPNGLAGCKVPNDIVKISVKEAMHMGNLLYDSSVMGQKSIHTKNALRIVKLWQITPKHQSEVGNGK